MSFGGRGKWSRQWREWRRRIVAAVVYPWDMIVGSCSWLVRTTGHAWNSRHLRYMIQGLPAVFATVGAIVLGVSVLGQQDKPNLAALYYMEAGRALTNQTFDLAQTYCEKAIELVGPQPEYCYFLVMALTAEADKKPEQALQKRNHALAIAKTLAPSDRTGYPPAHLWMGDMIGRYAPANAATLRMRENQYLRAYAGGLERDPMKFADTIKGSAERLGAILLLMQRPADAEKYMLRVADEKPMFKIYLGQYYKSINRSEESQRMFDSALEAFRIKLERNLDDHESRMGVVQVLIHQEKVDEALKELHNGLTLKPDEGQYTRAIAQIFAAKEAELARKPDAPIDERLFFIQSGLNMMPTNGYLLSRLFQLSELEGEEGEKSKKLMQAMLADGKSAPILHFLLGQRAYKDGKLTDAQNHWEQAYKLEPKFSFVANNLAWLMAHQKDADQKMLESALNIINTAIKQTRGVAEFHGTRGEILVKLGRFQEAIPDLAIGVNQSKENISLNAALLTAYENTGNTTMADIQRKKIEELQAKDVKPIIPEMTIPDGSKPVEPDKDSPSIVPPIEMPAPKDEPPAKR